MWQTLAPQITPIHSTSEKFTGMAAHPASAHVVCVHGWGLSAYATRYWQRKLEQNGFTTSGFAYQSRHRDLNDNAARLAGHIAEIATQGQGGRVVHLVGHSLGGVVIMHCVTRHAVQNIGRVVMVGTPFQKAIVGTRLLSRRIGRWLVGKTLPQWGGVTVDDLPTGLEVGTIAGTKPFGMGLLMGKLAVPNDGTVSLRETLVPFAKDRLVLHMTHSQLLISARVTTQIAQFLGTGMFAHEL